MCVYLQAKSKGESMSPVSDNSSHIPRRNALRRRLVPLYAVMITLIAFSFLWQMMHGICPVP
jgi:hypothetical protein